MIISKNNNRKKIEKKLLVFSMCSILAVSREFDTCNRRFTIQRLEKP